MIAGCHYLIDKYIRFCYTSYKPVTATLRAKGSSSMASNVICRFTCNTGITTGVVIGIPQIEFYTVNQLLLYGESVVAIR